MLSRSDAINLKRENKIFFCYSCEKERHAEEREREREKQNEKNIKKDNLERSVYVFG